MTTRKITVHTHSDPELDVYERQTEDEMVAEVAAARTAGTLRRGGLTVTRTTPAALEAQVAAAFDRESAQEAHAESAEARRAGGSVEPLVPVTIRMSAAMVAALKDEAARQGVRGYQTLLKQWIEERLTGEKVVSAQQVATAAEPLRRLIDGLT